MDAVFVPPPTSLSIVVSDQAGWYTLSVVTRISDLSKWDHVSNAHCCSSIGLTLQVGAMSRIEDHTRLARRQAQYGGGITVWGDEYGSVVNCRDIISSSLPRLWLGLK